MFSVSTSLRVSLNTPFPVLKGTVEAHGASCEGSQVVGLSRGLGQ